jgi:hypothetical protein
LYPTKFLSRGNAEKVKMLRTVSGIEKLKRSSSMHPSAFFSHYPQLGNLGHDELH